MTTMMEIIHKTHYSEEIWKKIIKSNGRLFTFRFLTFAAASLASTCLGSEEVLFRYNSMNSAGPIDSLRLSSLLSPRFACRIRLIGGRLDGGLVLRGADDDVAPEMTIVGFAFESGVDHFGKLSLANRCLIGGTADGMTWGRGRAWRFGGTTVDLDRWRLGLEFELWACDGDAEIDRAGWLEASGNENSLPVGVPTDFRRNRNRSFKVFEPDLDRWSLDGLVFCGWSSFCVLASCCPCCCCCWPACCPWCCRCPGLDELCWGRIPTDCGLPGLAVVIECLYR